MSHAQTSSEKTSSSAASSESTGSSTNHRRNENEFENLVKLSKNLVKSLENINKQLPKSKDNEKSDDKIGEALNANLHQLKKFCKQKKNYVERLFEKTNTMSFLISLLIRLYDQEIFENLKSNFISCLADLSYFERLKQEISVDENCENLFKALAIESDEQIWSKICRLSANFCTDKMNIRYLLKNDFLLSLAKCAENANSENFDFYFSLSRLLKYGCEKDEFRNGVLERRLLVHMCRFMNKNREHKRMNEDFMRQFVFIFKGWHNTCSEFYNQIIEGDTIDFLLWIYLDYASTTETSNNDSNSNSSRTNQTSLKSISFDLLYNYCKDSHACRAEFGRVNGIKKLIEDIDIDSWSSTSELSARKQKHVEILCFTCKEAVNRHRIKEQGFLSALMKLFKWNLTFGSNIELTKRLISSICSFAHDNDALNYFLQASIVDYFIEFLNSQLKTSSNDTNIFSSAYFENQFEKLQKCEHNTSECLYEKIINFNELLSNEKSSKQPSDDLATSSTRSANGSKRKMSASESCQQPIVSTKLKRSKFSHSSSNLPPQCSPTSPIYYAQPISPSYENAEMNFLSSRFSPLSQSDSLSPLPCYSPSASFLSSSPSANSRPNSAVMFENYDDYQQISPQPQYLEQDSVAENNTRAAAIQFSPSISICETLKTSDTDDESDEDVAKSEVENLKQAGEIFDASFSEDFFNRSSDIVPEKNIEVSNKTEACIFYVFSLLSHGQNPSPFIMTDKFFEFMLNYLKTDQAKNPRALRILNRLTKNPQCFKYFLSVQFSYKLKKVFNYLITENEFQISTLNFSAKTESEMEFYLNSNKVFFDSKIFPKLSSIEFQLNQNLKLHCMNASDACYQTLLGLIKYGTFTERQACVLQMPFILRNSKAIEHVMIQLNGMDLVLDCIIGENAQELFNEDNFYKGLLCIKKLINFFNYKQNTKQLKENYEKIKQKYVRKEPVVGSDEKKTAGEQVSSVREIEFLLVDEVDVEKQIVKADRDSLVAKSEYFNMLLNGSFSESLAQNKAIEIKEISNLQLSSLLELLNCSVENKTVDVNSKNESEMRNMSFKCMLNLIEICDRFMLFELKNYIGAYLALSYLSRCTFNECFEMAIRHNCSYLLNSCVEFLLAYEQRKSFSFRTASELSFIEFCYYFKGAVLLSIQSLSVKDFRLLVKTALTSIIKYKNWKY